MFAYTERRQAAITPHKTLAHAAEEQCPGMHALCNGAAGSQILNARMESCCKSSLLIMHTQSDTIDLSTSAE